MAFLGLTAAQTDANSPIDQTLTDLIRTNFDDLDSRITDITAGINYESVSTDFAITTLDTNIFEVGAGGSGSTALVTNDHYYNLLTGATSGIGNYGWIRVAATRMRLRLDREHSILVQWRAKMTVGENNDITMGMNDAGLSGASPVSDVTDFIGFIVGTASTDWKFRTAKGGTSSESTAVGSQSAWNAFRLLIIGSATAANRRIDAYIDTTGAGTSFSAVSNSPVTDNTRIPDTALLCPTYGCNGGSSQNKDMRVDYTVAYWRTRPLTA